MELALVIVLLVAMMFGVMDFSLALYADHWVSSASDDATRWASVRGSACTAPMTPCPAAAGDVQTYVKTTLLPTMLKSANVTVNTTWLNQTGNGTTTTTCSADAGTFNNPGCVVQVQVVYNYTFPFTIALGSGAQTSFNPLSGRVLQLKNTSQMVISQ